MKGVPVYTVEYKRFLTEKEAATYGGFTLTEFRRECPIIPIARAQGRKVWDVREIDHWLDGAKTTDHDSIIARLS